MSWVDPTRFTFGHRPQAGSLRVTLKPPYASTFPSAASRSAQYCFVRVAAALSGSFPCWIWTWAFDTPLAEAELDRRAVRPGDPHGLVARRGTDREVHVRQPARPRARVAERPIQPGQRHREHLALGGLERAIATLADGAQALDALVPHGDRLRPPPRDLVLLVHVLGDSPVRPGMRRDAIERFDPALPRAAGLRLHGGIAPTRERGVVRRSRDRGRGGRAS